MGESRPGRAALIAELANMLRRRSRCRSTISCRCPARRGRCSASILRVRQDHRLRPHHHAGQSGATFRRTPGYVGTNCRRCASWPRPIRFSTATSCYPQRIGTEHDTALFQRLDLKPCNARAMKWQHFSGPRTYDNAAVLAREIGRGWPSASSGEDRLCAWPISVVPAATASANCTPLSCGVPVAVTFL